MLNLSQVKKIYFIGIGGIGMSAVAGIAAARGFDVSGSDDQSVYDPAKAVLDKYKIRYQIGYNQENLQSADLVVASAAIDKNNPEMKKALENGLKVVSYPQLLAELVSDKRRLVVVGTHGKGSASGLLGFILKNLNQSGFFVGGVLKDFSANFYYGTGPDFILEGDEYKSADDDPTPKFMYYKADCLLINNLELDHPDIYKDIEALKATFRTLIAELPETGTIIYNADDKNVLSLVSGAKQKLISFGLKNKNADIVGVEPVLDPDSGLFLARFSYQGQEKSFKSIFPGLAYGHNNLAAIGALIALGYKPDDFLSQIEKYHGLKRRFEIISDSAELTVIDDYAHHPTAVLATLAAAREKYPTRRIIAFFEPHTYSRTKETLPALAKAFGPADLVFISEVYPARELKLPSSITGRQVVAAIAENRQNVFYIPDQAAAQHKIKEIVNKGDVIVVMSVGPYKVI